MAKILVVEDEKIVAIDLRNTLISLGYEVPDIASEAIEAITKTGKILPDLVLMDIILAGEMDGIDAAEQIRSRYDIPVIYLTSYANDEMLNRAKIAAPFGYIIKPFEERELHTNIEMALYRHQMERKLRDSEKRYRNLVENAHDAIYLITNDGFEYINHAFEKLSGYTGKELCHSDFNFWNLIHPDDREMINFRKQARKNKQLIPENYEFRILSKSAQEKTVEAITVDIGVDGELKVMGFLRDVTERRQMEKALRYEGERAQKYLDIARVIILALDIDGNVTLINQEGCRVLGYPETEIVAKNWLNTFLPPPSVPEVKSILKQLLADGIKNSTDYESPVITHSGELRIIAWHNTVLKDETNRITGILSSGEDITKRRQAERALQESEERYRELYHQAPVGYHEVDRHGYLLRVNKTEADMLGYKIEEMIGRPIFDFISPEQREHGQKEFFEKIEQILPLEGFERKYQRKDGEELFVYIEDRLTYDKTGLISGIRSTMQDISTRKNLEQQLLQSQKMEAIGRLAGGVAHDFNNLLTAILGITELIICDMEDSNPLLPDLEEINKAANRAAALTRQLLAFSRRQPLRPGALNLNEVITNMGKMLRRLIGENIELITTFKPELNLIEADQSQIEQVIMNLAVNAYNAMPEGGKLIIETENVSIDDSYCQNHSFGRVGKHVCLKISDTGIGMPDEIKHQIFEPFFSTKAPGIGTGLGLSVVYGIIKQHKGWITFKSDIGEGTEFSVYLPVIQDRKEAGIRKTTTRSKIKGQGERVLLVEDEEVVREFAARVLSENGYIVYKAECTNEAIRIFNNNNGNFDLIFSDVVLPDFSGVYLVDQLLAQKPDLHILLNSGYTEQKSQWPVIHERGFHFLQKPYAIADLLNAVSKALQD